MVQLFGRISHPLLSKRHLFILASNFTFNIGCHCATVDVGSMVQPYSLRNVVNICPFHKL